MHILEFISAISSLFICN